MAIGAPEGSSTSCARRRCRVSARSRRTGLGDVRGPVAVQARVEPARREQLLVRPLFDDTAMLEDDDEICMPNRGQAMRDDERGAASEQGAQRKLDAPLGADV